MNKADEDTDTKGSQQILRVQSVGRAVKILQVVAESAVGMHLSEIVARSGLPVQATNHLVHTLTATGMLMRRDRGVYSLGYQIGALADALNRQLAPPEHLMPMIRKIANESFEACYASGWVNGEIVTLVGVQGSYPIQAKEVSIGSQGAAHARASGKLLLALAPEGDRIAYLKGKVLTPRTPSTITNRKVLESELVQIAEQGYALDREEYELGLSCIAVPVGYAGARYALTLSAPTGRFTKNLSQYIEIMKRVARDS